MSLEDIDRMIADRKARIDKRKEDGTLFEEEIAKDKAVNTDENLASEVEEQKQKMQDRLEEQLPPCPQCGVKMTLDMPNSMVVCQGCGIGMRVQL